MVVPGNVAQELEHAERREDSPPVVARIAGEVRRADEKIVLLVQQRPLTTLCVAGAVGYLLGRVATRLG